MLMAVAVFIPPSLLSCLIPPVRQTITHSNGVTGWTELVVKALRKQNCITCPRELNALRKQTSEEQAVTATSFRSTHSISIESLSERLRRLFFPLQCQTCSRFRYRKVSATVHVWRLVLVTVACGCSLLVLSFQASFKGSNNSAIPKLCKLRARLEDEYYKGKNRGQEAISLA